MDCPQSLARVFVEKEKRDEYRQRCGRRVVMAQRRKEPKEKKKFCEVCCVEGSVG